MVSVYLPRFKEQMISQRIEFLQKHGELVALIVAEAAGRSRSDGDIVYDPLAANQVLRRIVNDVGGRAQLYDKTGRLTADTRNVFGVLEPIEGLPLPDIKDNVAFETVFEKISKYVEQTFSPTYETYQETSSGGIAQDQEVYLALEGYVGSRVRINSSNDLIVSVAVPVQKFKAVLGALVLSTDSGDIDAIVLETRRRILEIFSIILIVSIILSIVVSYTIAYPIIKLTRATETNSLLKHHHKNERIRIPDMKNRGDEIGALSASLSTMTDNFYSRIDAIESFAADVAHEIKNPLTSLRSAIESLRIVKKDADKDELMLIIEQDVLRMDRLLTDIANASRLDTELVREKAASFDLAILLHTIARTHQKVAQDLKTIDFQLNLHADSILIEGLENRLGQVFRNIIDNSFSFLKHNSDPRITIQTRANSDKSILVTIQDNGPGIPEDSLKLIFNRFYTSRPSYEAFGQHSGLGLNICEQIIKAHGGRIWAENLPLPTQGAKFCIIIPSVQSNNKRI